MRDAARPVSTKGGGEGQCPAAPRSGTCDVRVAGGRGQEAAAGGVKLEASLARTAAARACAESEAARAAAGQNAVAVLRRRLSARTAELEALYTVQPARPDADLFCCWVSGPKDAHKDTHQHMCNQPCQAVTLTDGGAIGRAGLPVGR